jgi:hypothetical protein
MPDQCPPLTHATEVSLSSIRTLWRSISPGSDQVDGCTIDLDQELESYLNASTFSAMLRMDGFITELQSSAKPRLTADQLGRLEAIRRQISLCSDIGLFSIQQSREKRI